MVKINGTFHDAAGRTVSELLAEMSYDPRRVAVERNDEIIPRASYDAVILEDGDSVEIVSFVGGG